MEHMLNEYLDFARGGAGEQASVNDLVTVSREAAQRAVRARMAEPRRLIVSAPEPVVIAVKPHALGRCVTNLVDNALKHGRHVFVSVSRDERFAEIVVDDDGPGIPELCAKKRSGRLRGWIRAAIFRLAAWGLALPSHAILPVPMAANLCSTKARRTGCARQSGYLSRRQYPSAACHKLNFVP